MRGLSLVTPPPIQPRGPRELRQARKHPVQRLKLIISETPGSNPTLEVHAADSNNFLSFPIVTSPKHGFEGVRSRNPTSPSPETSTPVELSY